MERGYMRAQKALSRSPLIRKLALTRYEAVRVGSARLEDLVIIGVTEEGSMRRSRAKAMRLFEKLAEVDHDLSRLKEKFALMPKGKAEARAKLARQIIRL